jgi:formate hydrogenlyase subunit 3/multisubunit Na+/H+ antiporter MnhD subunit
MLSFSSIGQLGLVFVAFSIPGEAGILAGLAVALHHLVVKPGLFLLAERWSGALGKLQGAGRASPWAVGLFVLFALSLVGVPPLPGFWAKLLTIIGLVGQDQPIYLLAAVTVLVATVIEVNYLFRFMTILFAKGETPAETAAPHDRGTLAVATLSGFALVIAMVFLTPLADRMSAIAGEVSDRGLYISTVLGQPGDQP